MHSQNEGLSSDASAGVGFPSSTQPFPLPSLTGMEMHFSSVHIPGFGLEMMRGCKRTQYCSPQERSEMTIVSVVHTYWT